MQAQPPARPDLRALKALVGGMGVLIVLGTAVVIAVVALRLYARPAAPSTAAGAAQVPGALPFLLPAGAHVAGIAAAGGAIAVWTSGPAGDQVLLVDPASGAVTRVIARSR